MDTLTPKLPTRKSSTENILYFFVFGAILVTLLYYVLKHFKSIFLIGLKNLDEYVINDKGLDKEPFAVSLPNSPKVFVLNTAMGSAISFKPVNDKSIKGYLCMIKNTTKLNAPIQLKTLTDIKKYTDTNGYIVMDLDELNDADTYSIVVYPLTKQGKGMPSNMVYAYKQDDDPNAKYLTTTPFDDNLENYNFSTNITKNIYKS